MAEQEKRIRLTAEGYKKAQDELDFLISTERNRIAEQISVARSYGDLSENAEYDEAKNEQSRIENRIAELEILLANAEVAEKSADDIVGMGSKVTIRNLAQNKELVVTIVGANEIDLKEMKLSSESPIGSALLGHKVGEIVEVDAPKGKSSYQILSI